MQPLTVLASMMYLISLILHSCIRTYHVLKFYFIFLNTQSDFNSIISVYLERRREMNFMSASFIMQIIYISGFHRKIQKYYPHLKEEISKVN